MSLENLIRKNTYKYKYKYNYKYGQNWYKKYTASTSLEYVDGWEREQMLAAVELQPLLSPQLLVIQPTHSQLAWVLNFEEHFIFEHGENQSFCQIATAAESTAVSNSTNSQPIGYFYHLKTSFEFWTLKRIISSSMGKINHFVKLPPLPSPQLLFNQLTANNLFLTFENLSWNLNI